MGGLRHWRNLVKELIKVEKLKEFIITNEGRRQEKIPMEGQINKLFLG